METLLIVMCFLTIGSLVLGILLVPFRDKCSKRYNEFLGSCSDYFAQAFGWLLGATLVMSFIVVMVENLSN